MSARIAIWLGLVMLAALHGAAARGVETPQLSAKPIEVLSTFETDVDNQRAFAVKYRTSRPIQDGMALRSEAAMLWQRYHDDIERAGYRRAVFAAVGHVAGAMKDERVSTVFERRAGAWHMVEAAEPTKLDEDYIRAYMARLDWAEQHTATNTFLLFLADDWQRIAKNAAEGAKPIPDIGRSEFAEVMRRVFQATDEYRHTREIVHIAIDPDGRGAQVDSRETQRSVMHISQRESTMFVRSRNYLEIRGNAILVARTVYLVDKVKMSAAD